MDNKTLKKNLESLLKEKEEILSKQKDQDNKLTYWNGYSLGYIKGKISLLKDLIK